MGANNTFIDKSGSVILDVDVPDFEKEPLSLSGLVFSAASAPPVAAAGALQSLIPVVPTTVRHLGSNDRATAFLRLYQRRERAAQPVEVTARVRTPDGRIAYHRTTVLEDGAADFALQLPTTELSPGPYLLKVEANLPTGQTRRRELRFSDSLNSRTFAGEVIPGSDSGHHPPDGCSAPMPNGDEPPRGAVPRFD